jgi:hypothetical protein
MKQSTFVASFVLSLVGVNVALAQAPAYSVNVLAPLPQFAQSSQLDRWWPRGVLPDGSVVMNVSWEIDFEGGTTRRAAVVVGPGGTTVINGADGSALDAFVMGVEPSGRVQFINTDGSSPEERFLTWQNGVTSSQATTLGITPFAIFDVSPAGHLLGMYYDGLDRPNEVIFNGTRRELPRVSSTSFGDTVTAVNSFGSVSGIALGSTGFVGVVWDDSGTRLLDFPVLEGPNASGGYSIGGINDLGWVVGSIGMSDGVNTLFATILWRGNERLLLPYATLGNVPAVDNLGTVLSTDDTGAYLWRDGGIYRLDDLNLSGFTGTLLSIDRLELDGRAIGQAIVDGVRVPVVLTPIPTPGGLVLAVVGLGLAGLRSRRRSV